MKIIQLLTPTKFGHSRSKALNATPRTWKGNHQKFRLILPNGKKQTIYTSVRTYRSMAKYFNFHKSGATKDVKNTKTVEKTPPIPQKATTKS